MMNTFKKIFKTKNVPPILDPLIGKTVIQFITHGCQAQIHEFDFIGTIVGIVIKKQTMIYGVDKYKFYKVEVLKGAGGEKINNNLKKQFEEVPSWYLQDIGGDFLVCYQ